MALFFWEGTMHYSRQYQECLFVYPSLSLSASLTLFLEVVVMNKVHWCSQLYEPTFFFSISFFFSNNNNNNCQLAPALVGYVFSCWYFQLLPALDVGGARVTWDELFLNEESFLVALCLSQTTFNIFLTYRHVSPWLFIPLGLWHRCRALQRYPLRPPVGWELRWDLLYR